MKGWLPHSAISRRPAQIFPQIAVGQNRFCGLSALQIFLLAFSVYSIRLYQHFCRDVQGFIELSYHSQA